MSERRFLFLQGFHSPFLARLGDRLRSAGHPVYRVNFSVGDALSWLGRPAWNFQGTLEEWPDYLADKFYAHGFTDVVLMGDTRPLHEAALSIARRYGARVNVLEEGYFRPNWVTLEEGGVNGYSRLPKDPEWYREAGRLVPHYGDGEPVSAPLPLLAAHGIAFRTPNLLNPLLFPGYKTHLPRLAAGEIYGWARRFAFMPWYRRRDNARIERLVRGGGRFFLLPLQLNIDSQIRKHSSFPGIPHLVERVVRSFLRRAPEDARLVVKNHPLDAGYVDYPGLLRRVGEEFGGEGRLLYLESGHTPTLLRNAAGVVTANSTVGPSALLHNCPVVALGAAIYDLPGLTHQGELDDFWEQGAPPDRNLFQDFRNTVIHTTQVNGGFHSRKGIQRTSAACAERLQQDRTPLEALLHRTGAQPAPDGRVGLGDVPDGDQAETPDSIEE